MTPPLPSAPLPVRFEQGPARMIAGLCEHFTPSTRSAIPALWARLEPALGHLAAQVDRHCYGVCLNPDASGGFDYLAGVEVRDADDLPAGFISVEIPAGAYAVFDYRGPVSGLPDVFEYIWCRWLPDADVAVAATPFFDRFGDDYDPHSDSGSLEIWLPIVQPSHAHDGEQQDERHRRVPAGGGT